MSKHLRSTGILWRSYYYYFYYYVWMDGHRTFLLLPITNLSFEKYFDLNDPVTCGDVWIETTQR